jgi:hypothetical protein
MSELIADLDYLVVDPTGGEYYVSVAADMGADGRWEAWLEFVPLDDSSVRVTPTQTHQPTRAAVEHWATTLGKAYVEGAFQRAVSAVTLLPPSRIVARAAPPEVAVASPAGIDPFALITQGKPVLRSALRPLSRAELVSLISSYGLNPSSRSLAWLTHAQLITFIATAVEVQMTQGKRERHRGRPNLKAFCLLGVM